MSTPNLHDIHLCYLSPKARELHAQLVAEGLDTDLAFEVLGASLPEWQLYELEDELNKD